MGKDATFLDLSGRPTLKDVAALIKRGKAKKIVVMTGAGISTAAGIPDFRSPDTGLYANLEKYNLPMPEAMFEINYFVRRPEAFFALAKELYPGNFKPTLAHYFFALLHRKQLLLRCFSQNIDCLESLAGVPTDKIVEAHGSFATAHCLSCGEEHSADSLRPRIDKGEVVRCTKEKCKSKANGLIKPDIVFFGEGLPKLFFNRLSDLGKADLLLVLGTSLQVQPFASLVDRVSDDCPRVLINLERVGEMDEYEAGGGMFGRFRETGFDFAGRARGGERFARDVMYEGMADDGVLELAEALGWKEELLEMYEEGHARLEKTTRSIATPQKPKRVDASKEADEVAAKVAEAVQGEDSRPSTPPKPTVDDLTEKVAKVDLTEPGDAKAAKASL